MRLISILLLKLGIEMSIIGQGAELNEATKSTVGRRDRWVNLRGPLAIHWRKELLTSVLMSEYDFTR